MAGAVSPELLRKARETSLLSRYARGGKISASELAEIQHLLPPAEGVDSNLQVPPAAERKQYRKHLKDYCATYDTTLRPIKRWLEIGREAVEQKKPGAALPPLDEPELMAGWWENHMTQRVPAKILALAAAGQAPAAAEARKAEAVDVSKLNIEDLDSLRQAKRYLGAVDANLSAAYASGDEAQIRRWQKPFNEAIETVRKLEAAQREADKAAGEVIPKIELFNDLSTFLETLRQMRASMARRVASRLSDLGPDVLERIGAVIAAEMEVQERVLRQLKQFRSIEEVQFQLQAGG